ncbi:hypothetical protein CR513_04599, partial [Mucuna pruriens]
MVVQGRFEVALCFFSLPTMLLVWCIDPLDSKKSTLGQIFSKTQCARLRISVKQNDAESNVQSVDLSRSLAELLSSILMLTMNKPIVLKEQAQSYELKYGLTHLLPKYHGLTSNTQQFGIRGSAASKIRVKNKITELISLVRQLAIGLHHISSPIRVCDIFAFVEHPTDACLTLQEIEPQRY